MSQRQPNRAARVLVIALCAALILCRSVLNGDVRPAIRYLVIGVTVLLALAYLASFFFFGGKTKRSGGAASKQLDAWLKDGVISEREYERLRADLENKNTDRQD